MNAHAHRHGRRLVPAGDLCMDDVVTGRGGDAVVVCLWARRGTVAVTLADLHTGARKVRLMDARKPVRLLARG